MYYRVLAAMTIRHHREVAVVARDDCIVNRETILAFDVLLEAAAHHLELVCRLLGSKTRSRVHHIKGPRCALTPQASSGTAWSLAASDALAIGLCLEKSSGARLP